MNWAPFTHIVILLAFLDNTLGFAPLLYAQELRLPAPGVMVRLSPAFMPPVLKGLKVHPEDPFRFDFILNTGEALPKAGQGSQQEQLKQESARLIKYFLASLTIPEKDLWVNLSPYEKDRIIPSSFGLTEMGRDLLAEDYMLKQITASLIYPEDALGKKFWQRVYAQAQAKYGTTDVRVNTFNKVWIIPEKAVVYENSKAGTAYVVESRLKVMLEEDYLSMSKHQGQPAMGAGTPNDIIREIVLPELTREVNENKNFAQLRQVYSSLILATWYKKKIKDSILAEVYADQRKTLGLSYKNDDVKAIYARYLQAFKKGVFNYIKDSGVPPMASEPSLEQSVPRKYFSGGFGFNLLDRAMTILDKDVPGSAMAGRNEIVEAQIDRAGAAMNAGYKPDAGTLLIVNTWNEHLKAINDLSEVKFSEGRRFLQDWLGNIVGGIGFQIGIMRRAKLDDRELKTLSMSLDQLMKGINVFVDEDNGYRSFSPQTAGKTPSAWAKNVLKEYSQMDEEARRSYVNAQRLADRILLKDLKPSAVRKAKAEKLLREIKEPFARMQVALQKMIKDQAMSGAALEPAAAISSSKKLWETTPDIIAVHQMSYSRTFEQVDALLPKFIHKTVLYSGIFDAGPLWDKYKNNGGQYTSTGEFNPNNDHDKKAAFVGGMFTECLARAIRSVANLAFKNQQSEYVASLIAPMVIVQGNPFHASEVTLEDLIESSGEEVASSYLPAKIALLFTDRAIEQFIPGSFHNETSLIVRYRGKDYPVNEKGKKHSLILDIISSGDERLSDKAMKIDGFPDQDQLTIQEYDSGARFKVEVKGRHFEIEVKDTPARDSRFFYFKENVKGELLNVGYIYNRSLKQAFDAISGIYVEDPLREQGLSKLMIRILLNRMCRQGLTVYSDPKVRNALLLQVLINDFGFRPVSAVKPNAYYLKRVLSKSELTALGYTPEDFPAGRRVFITSKNFNDLVLDQASEIKDQYVISENLKGIADNPSTVPLYLGQAMQGPGNRKAGTKDINEAVEQWNDGENEELIMTTPAAAVFKFRHQTDGAFKDQHQIDVFFNERKVGFIHFKIFNDPSKPNAAWMDEAFGPHNWTYRSPVVPRTALFVEPEISANSNMKGIYRGVGRTLLGLAERLAYREGAKGFFAAGVSRDNFENFYQKLGFRDAQFAPNYDAHQTVKKELSADTFSKAAIEEVERTDLAMRTAAVLQNSPNATEALLNNFSIQNFLSRNQDLVSWVKAFLKRDHELKEKAFDKVNGYSDEKVISEVNKFLPLKVDDPRKGLSIDPVADIRQLMLHPTGGDADLRQIIANMSFLDTGEHIQSYASVYADPSASIEQAYLVFRAYEILSRRSDWPLFEKSDPDPSGELWQYYTVYLKSRVYNGTAVKFLSYSGLLLEMLSGKDKIPSSADELAEYIKMSDEKGFKIHESLKNYIALYDQLIQNVDWKPVLTRDAQPDEEDRIKYQGYIALIKNALAILDSAQKSVLNKGGIDLTPAHLSVQTQNAGEAVKFHLDPALLQRLRNASGFVPVIIRISPLPAGEAGVADLRTFLSSV